MEEPRNRAYLKKLFGPGKVPTGSDFNTVFQSQVNIIDDQIVRKKDGTNLDSLCIGAGSNGALLSFFSMINNPNGDWNLSLSGDQKGLSFKAQTNAKSILFLDPTGKVGIGTDQPKTSLDVVGDISATNLQLSNDLNVSGMAIVKSLSISGFGTITDVDSLRRILGTSAATAPTSGFGAGGGGGTSGGSNSGGSGSSTTKQDGGTTSIASPPTAANSTIDVLANRKWQPVAGPFSSFNALQAVAWVDSIDHRSICCATAVCVDGDPSTNAILHAQSYQGRPGAKIQFRWFGPREAYYLQCRLGMDLPETSKIHIKINYLLP